MQSSCTASGCVVSLTMGVEGPAQQVWSGGLLLDNPSKLKKHKHTKHRHTQRRSSAKNIHQLAAYHSRGSMRCSSRRGQKAPQQKHCCTPTEWSTAVSTRDAGCGVFKAAEEYTQPVGQLRLVSMRSPRGRTNLGGFVFLFASCNKRGGCLTQPR